MPQSFYSTFTTASALDREVDRLRGQARIGWEQEHECLVRAGLRDGLRLVEIGCGPGVFADLVLSHYPRTAYTALDHDHAVLARAAEEITPRRRANVRLVCGSAAATGIADNSCDFVLARFVFQHLPDPGAAMREIARILRPGGRVAIVDSDDAVATVFDPPIPAIRRIAIKVALAQLFQGGDRKIGRKLGGMLRQAGFREVRCDMVVLPSDDIGLEPFRLQYQIVYLSPLVDSGLLTQDEYDAAGDGLDRFFATAGASIVDHRFIACGTKPPDAA